VGGAKVSDKVLVIDNLIDRSDKIILCGGMAYTFMKTIYGMPSFSPRPSLTTTLALTLALALALALVHLREW
jgi:hypothetical protein